MPDWSPATGVLLQFDAEAAARTADVAAELKSALGEVAAARAAMVQSRAAASAERAARTEVGFRLCHVAWLSLRQQRQDAIGNAAPVLRRSFWAHAFWGMDRTKLTGVCPDSPSEAESALLVMSWSDLFTHQANRQRDAAAAAAAAAAGQLDAAHAATAKARRQLESAAAEHAAALAEAAGARQHLEAAAAEHAKALAAVRVEAATAREQLESATAKHASLLAAAQAAASEAKQQVEAGAAQHAATLTVAAEAQQRLEAAAAKRADERRQLEAVAAQLPNFGHQAAAADEEQGETLVARSQQDAAGATRKVALGLVMRQMLQFGNAPAQNQNVHHCSTAQCAVATGEPEACCWFHSVCEELHTL